MNDAPIPQRGCPACGAALNRNSPRGLCVRCLVNRALSQRPPAPDSPFALPSVEDLNALFADLVVRGLLGRGGMGAVYEAWQKSLARPVALKILPSVLTGDSEFLERFQRLSEPQHRADLPHHAISHRGRVIAGARSCGSETRGPPSAGARLSEPQHRADLPRDAISHRGGVIAGARSCGSETRGPPSAGPSIPEPPPEWS